MGSGRRRQLATVRGRSDRRQGRWPRRLPWR